MIQFMKYEYKSNDVSLYDVLTMLIACSFIHAFAAVTLCVTHLFHLVLFERSMIKISSL